MELNILLSFFLILLLLGGAVYYLSRKNKSSQKYSKTSYEEIIKNTPKEELIKKGKEGLEILIKAEIEENAPNFPELSRKYLVEFDKNLLCIKTTLKFNMPGLPPSEEIVNIPMEKMKEYNVRETKKMCELTFRTEGKNIKSTNSNNLESEFSISLSKKFLKDQKILIHYLQSYQDYL